MKRILEVTNLTKSFVNQKTKEDFIVLDSISFKLHEGEILGIMGPSGCGKSTLLKLIKGFERPDSGQIFFEGKDITYSSPQKTKEIQLIFQDPYSSFNPALKLRTQIKEVLKKAQCDENYLDELLDRFHLPKEILFRHPRSVSGGQLQRLAVLRALLMGPKVLLADEPTSSLDLSVQAKMLNLFAELQSALKLSIIFVSHDPDVINYISDRVIKLRAI